MNIDWDSPIRVDDGLVLRADVFRPADGRRADGLPIRHDGPRSEPEDPVWSPMGPGTSEMGPVAGWDPGTYANRPPLPSRPEVRFGTPAPGGDELTRSRALRECGLGLGRSQIPADGTGSAAGPSAGRKRIARLVVESAASAPRLGHKPS